jgi:hypothetical protein
VWIVSPFLTAYNTVQYSVTPCYLYFLKYSIKKKEIGRRSLKWEDPFTEVEKLEKWTDKRKINDESKGDRIGKEERILTVPYLLTCAVIIVETRKEFWTKEKLTLSSLLLRGGEGEPLGPLMRPPAPPESAAMPASRDRRLAAAPERTPARERPSCRPCRAATWDRGTATPFSGGGRRW